jgi:hypothetical protein
VKVPALTGHSRHEGDLPRPAARRKRQGVARLSSFDEVIMDEDSIDNEALDVLLNAGSRWVLYLLLALVVAMIIASPRIAGARNTAERRGVMIASPRIAGARSATKRRGVMIERRPSLGTSVPVLGAGAAMIGMMSSHVSFSPEAGLAQIVTAMMLGVLLAWSSAPRKQLGALLAR